MSLHNPHRTWKPWICVVDWNFAQILLVLFLFLFFFSSFPNIWRLICCKLCESLSHTHTKYLFMIKKWNTNKQTWKRATEMCWKENGFTIDSFSNKIWYVSSRWWMRVRSHVRAYVSVCVRTGMCMCVLCSVTFDFSFFFFSFVRLAFFRWLHCSLCLFLCLSRSISNPSFGIRWIFCSFYILF